MIAPKATVRSVIEATVAVTGVRRDQLEANTRQRDFMLPRQVAMYVAAKHGNSYKKIGRALGDRDHTTILHGVKKIAAMLEQPGPVADRVREMVSRIEQALVLRLKEPANNNVAVVVLPAREPEPEPAPPPEPPKPRQWTAGYVDKETGAIICNPW